MKDKKTLITIIVLLCIFVPSAIYGTYKHIDIKKHKLDDNNVNKDFIYNNKLYFYQDDKLLSTYACSTCAKAKNTYKSEYHTNYYQFGSEEIEPVINSNFGIFQNNGAVMLYNLVGSAPVDTYEEVINYGTPASSKFLINKKDGKWGIIFLDFSSNTIGNDYDYIALPAHFNEDVLSSAKFIVKQNNLWYILNADGTLYSEASSVEIVDFNDSYYITYDGTYHILDYNGVEYLANINKVNVYGVGKYIFIMSDNNLLLMYERCNDSLRQQLVLPEHESIYFKVRDNGIDIMLDEKKYQSLDLR